MFEGEQRVKIRVTNGQEAETERKGTLISQGSAGGLVIPDGSKRAFPLRYGEFQILPDDPQPPAGQTSPQQA